MRIINAKIETMAGRSIENGYMEFQDGKICALGDMRDCPQGGETLDAAGRYLLPGFVDAHSHLGMWEDSTGYEGDDGNEDTDPLTPHLRGLDSVNPLDRAFEEALAWGVTTVVTGPGSANVISGQMCAMKTRGVCVDDMIIKEPIAIKMALGENPKNAHHEKEQGPSTRMGVAAVLREQLAKARKYAEQLDRAKEDEDYDEPEFDAKCEALLPLLRGEICAHIHAHRLDDIFTAARIAKEFSFPYVLIHATQGHLAAQRLAALDVPAVVGPLMGARTKPELAGMSDENPALLHKAGMEVAICTDHPETPARYLLLSAQMAIHAGMMPQAALEAITSVPARICGLQNRVGSLAPGLDADFVLLDEPPASSSNKPWAVFLDGKRVY